MSDNAIIEPVDYSAALSPKQCKMARQAVNLIEPIDRNQEPRAWASWGSAISGTSKPSVRAVCLRDVEEALSDINFALFIEKFYAFGLTKPEKEKADQIASALRRANDSARNFNKRDFPLKDFPFGELERWHKVFAEMKRTPSGSLTRLNALKKRLAVAEAYWLLRKYGSSTRVPATKGGKFCKLAALLFGDPRANLINQCKAQVRTKAPGAAEYTELIRVQRNQEGEKSGAK